MVCFWVQSRDWLAAPSTTYAIGRQKASLTEKTAGFGSKFVLTKRHRNAAMGVFRHITAL
jgi:hypothetical protein